MSKESRKDWPRVKFGDVVRLSKARCADPLAEGIERFVGLEHLEPGDLRIQNWGSVADGITFTSVFKPGQVLFGKRRAYQRKVAVAEFTGVCSGDIYVLESLDANILLPDLLPFICQTDAFFEHAVGTSAGSLSPRTNWSSLSGFEFALPSNKEQKGLLYACQVFEESVRAYESAFMAAIGYNDSLRESIFDICSSEIRLSDVLSDIQAGKSLVGIDEPSTEPDQKAVLKVSAVGKLAFLPTESKILIKQEEFLNEHSVREGDVLISRANTPELVGLVCHVNHDHQNLMLSDKTLRLVPKEGVPSLLLVESLRTKAARQYLKANATGTGGAMKNISQAKLRDMPIRFPTQEQWDGLVPIVKAAVISIENIANRFSNAKAFQRRATQQMFVGE
ncbi:MAG: hypothetical protein ABSB19_06365 [Methylomonas sp.]|jgi:type I restriction enzyme S subunit